MTLAELLQSRLLCVTGKGGTGKTTLSVALARLVASQGRRVVLVEVDNQRSIFSEYFGRDPTYEPVQVEPNLDITNITWMDALVSWLGDTVNIPRIARLILNNRMVSAFIFVTPGSREVVSFARLVHLFHTYDLVVLDLPASGHAVSFFRVPFSAMRLFLTGPIHKVCVDAVEMIRQPRSCVVVAALPEEMVVNETVETWNHLALLAPELAPRKIFLNQSLPPSLTEQEKTLLERLARGRDLRPLSSPSESTEDSSLIAELLRAGWWEAQRETATSEASETLAHLSPGGVFSIPIFTDADNPGDVARRMEALLRRSLLVAEGP